MKLFVDSSSKYLYIDVIDKDLKYSFNRMGKNDHSEMLVSSLEEYLKELKYTVNDIEEIYIGRGPGSYTGVRISGTFGKTISFIKNLKFYSFSSLDYLLSSYLEKDGKYIAAIDAKKNHSYLKAIIVKDKQVEVVLEETFANNEIFANYPDYIVITPNEINGNVNSILKYNLYQEEDNLEYSPNYIRSEFN